ncbi:unnamed protein product [Mytilus edulis]|uniref:Death domain-containing protein n=1 Tax=Mytilus edulis TaxID=6550 RepID=A0A8S3QCI7_MYTED|nr:unnamed protein product [Mytilus edulis]
MRNCFIKDIKSMFSNYDKKEHLHLETVYFINGIDKHDAEIQRMTDQVVQFAVEQTSWGQRRPMQWVPLELQISNMRMKNINIITKADLLNVNQLNNDLALEGRQLNDFLLVQHSLGKLMFYNLPGLDNFIIIHPPALVNILRSFVTDEKFFPDEPNLKTILLKMTTTGKISKTELLKLWEQHQFQQYMQDESIKEFVVQLLMHLDILVIPKASKQTNVYLVPCMIKSTRPSHFNSTENQEGNTICLRYTIARHSIPTSLAYKIIGASICAWPLKYEDNKPCLYHKAALVNVSQDIELRIWIEDNHVMVVMTNELALIHISPDVAASVQECLTKNLESSLLFHYNSFGKQMKPTKASELYTMEVGIPCGQDVCYTSLQDVIMQDKWICEKEKNHDTRYLRYWTFNKSQTTCGPECKGLNNNEIRTEPSDKHLVRLGNQIGIKLFDDFFINLKMDRKKWESIEYTYAGHSPEGIMSMALVKWKECKLENMDDPTLNDLSEALAAVKLDTHAICQVFRENTKLQDIADFKLLETPGDDVLEELSKQIGNCALQLGIELGVSFHKLQSSFIKFPKDLPGLLEDILKIWKTESKVPTYHSLMMALTRVDGGGVGYLRKLFI